MLWNMLTRIINGKLYSVIRVMEHGREVLRFKDNKVEYLVEYNPVSDRIRRITHDIPVFENFEQLKINIQ
jgi:hypothetical protein